LLRWQHPERGLLSPAEFLPLIEDHALIETLGEQMLEAALTQMDQWQSQGLTIPVSINVSARQFKAPDFCSKLATRLAAHPHIAPHLLELELVESSALDHVDDVARTMRRCIESGLHFAIDDFGTGYSTLTYLKRLPVATLKIDQSFVRTMLDDAEDMAIVKGVIGLASAFNRQVIAEGVETVAHGAMLLSLGCEQAQGYGIARPMPGNELAAWAGNWQSPCQWREAA
jgi:EAL domain-containing protein (putative c-di-GMP-specific phosphodiesterase class I)